MEAGEANKTFNISRDLFIDWSGKDNVTVSAKGMNDALTRYGQWDSSNEILILKMEQGKLILENDLLADAVGSLVFSNDELTLNVTLTDPAEGLKCEMFGEVFWDAGKFEANSRCEYRGKKVWDMGVSVPEGRRELGLS